MLIPSQCTEKDGFFNVFYPVCTVSWKHLQMPDQVPHTQLFISCQPTAAATPVKRQVSCEKTGLLRRNPSVAMQQIRRPPPLEKGVKQGLVSRERVKAELKYPYTPTILSSMRTTAIRCNSSESQESNPFPEIQKSSRFKSPLLTDFSQPKGGKALNNPFNFCNICREG